MVKRSLNLPDGQRIGIEENPKESGKTIRNMECRKKVKAIDRNSEHGQRVRVARRSHSSSRTPARTRESP